ncbi:MAG: fasciclin domain-containing protein [Clostridium sp.]|nr:fasciclin domain-containing protein [Clostridium sp.]
MKYKIQTGLAAMVAATSLTVGCSDAWDDHYGNGSEVQGNTLWQVVSNDGQLTQFARVLDCCGYSTRLNDRQVFTVFAPVIDEHTADSLIEVYNTEKQRGVKDTENAMIVQFLNNHIALYGHSVSSQTNDSLYMWNGKNMRLTSTAFGNHRFVGDGQQVASNGILYKIDGIQPYYRNVWEQVQYDPRISHIADYISTFSRYELDTDASVPGGVVDGNIVYLDSVMHFTNDLIGALGWINREDSSYIMMAPVNDVWDDKLEQYKQYYVYNSRVTGRDSLQQVRAAAALLEDLVFNRNTQKSIEDSICSTTYSPFTPGYSVFQKPFQPGGLFYGMEKVECSNGFLYVAEQFPIHPEQSYFMRAFAMEAESDRYYTIDDENLTNCYERTVPAASEFDVSDDKFLLIASARTSNTSVTFSLPNVLSGCYYDIYCVFVPAIAYDENATAQERLPYRASFYLSYKQANGTYYNERFTTALNNPDPKPGIQARYYVTEPDVMDTVLVAKNIKFPVTNIGDNDTEVKLQLRSNVSQSDQTKYSRNMRVDCFLLRPHVEEE